MKKVFLIFSRFPLPKIGGQEKILLEYLEYLKEPDNQIFLYAFDKRIACSIPGFDKIVHEHGKIAKTTILHLIGLPRILLNIFFYSVIRREKSFQECAFYSSKVQNFFQREIEEKLPDVIFCDLLRTAQFFNCIKGTHKPLRIFSMCDLLSNRYKQLCNTDGNFLGNMEERLPIWVSRIINSIVRSTILSLEAFLVRQSEMKYVQSFDKTLLVSPKEAATVQEMARNAKVSYLYPKGEISLKTITRKNINKYLMCYMGFLGNPQNAKGLEHFLESVLPRLAQSIPQLKLKIIGAGINKSLQKRIFSCGSIVSYLGFVPDCEKILSAANVFISPVYFGTGIKTKIIDAMGLGQAVAATSSAAEGLSVTHGENIMIAENDSQYIENISFLISSDHLNDRIRINARSYVEKFHSREVLQKQFHDLLEL